VIDDIPTSSRVIEIKEEEEGVASKQVNKRFKVKVEVIIQKEN